MYNKRIKSGTDCYLQNVNKNCLINLLWEQIVSRFDKTKGKEEFVFVILLTCNKQKELWFSLFAGHCFEWYIEKEVVFYGGS